MQADDEYYQLTRDPSDGGEMSSVRTKAQSTEAAETVVSGWVDYASWLSDDILLLVELVHAEEKCQPKVHLILDDRVDDHAAPLESRCLSYPRPGSANVDSRAGKVIIARFLNPEDARRPLGSVVIQQDATTFAVGPLKLSQAMTDLQTLVHNGFLGLDPEVRAEVLEFLVSIPLEHRGMKSDLRLSKNLFVIREALREQLPEGVIAQSEPRGLAVDTILAVDE